MRDLHVRTRSLHRDKIIDIIGVDVSGPIGRPRHQMERHIPDAGSDFEHAISDIRANYIRHPTSKARGAIQSTEDLGAISVSGVELVGKRVAQDRPERAESVLPADLFPLAVSTARITDGNLENAAAAAS